MLAENFTLPDQNGKQHTLTDYIGKWVVLYFYPKDDTPGCTAESCNLRDNYSSLKKKGYEILGVSADTVKSHKKFEQKFKLPFPLLADTERKIIDAYSVWGKKKFWGKEFMGIVRTTFIIDEKGKIEKVIKEVDTEGHTEQVLA